MGNAAPVDHSPLKKGEKGQRALFAAKPKKRTFDFNALVTSFDENGLARVGRSFLDCVLISLEVERGRSRRPTFGTFAGAEFSASTSAGRFDLTRVVAGGEIAWRAPGAKS